MERHHTEDKQTLSCAGVVKGKILQDVKIKQTAKGGGIFKNGRKSEKTEDLVGMRKKQGGFANFYLIRKICRSKI